MWSSCMSVVPNTIQCQLSEFKLLKKIRRQRMGRIQKLTENALIKNLECLINNSGILYQE